MLQLGVLPYGQVLCVLPGCQAWVQWDPQLPRQRPLVPYREPFVLAKLRSEDGLYLIHWSTSHLNRLILTVAQRDQVGLGRGSWAGAGRAPCLDPCSPPPCPATLQSPGTQRLHLRKFPIELQAGVFRLEGWDRSFPSVRELRAALQGCSLRAGDDCFSLRRCCLPRPGGRPRGPRLGAAPPPPHPSASPRDVTSIPRDLQPHHYAGAPGCHKSTQRQPAQLPPDLPG